MCSYDTRIRGCRNVPNRTIYTDNSCTAFFANIFVAIFGLHVLSGKYALIEIKVNTILAQCFGIQLALNLFNEFINGISENEVSFEGRMGM